MKKIYTFIFGIIFSIGIFAQTFSGGTGNIQNGWTDYAANVTGVGTIDSLEIEVCIDISYIRVCEFDVLLEVNKSGTRRVKAFASMVLTE